MVMLQQHAALWLSTMAYTLQRANFDHQHAHTQAAAALVQAAYQQGSSDNISAVIIRITRRKP